MQKKSSHLLVGAMMAVLALSSSTTTHANKLHPDEQKRTLLAYLNAHEFQVDKKIMEEIGRDVNRLLVHIASNPHHRPTVRQRAYSALSVYPTTRTRKFLETSLFDPNLKAKSPGTALRREAMRSLAIAFGASTVTILDDFMNDDEAQIREGVAHAMGLTKCKEALTLLEAWLPNEPELFVRLAVDRAIESLRPWRTSQ
jgi:HEAT repeat protein